MTLDKKLQDPAFEIKYISQCICELQQQAREAVYDKEVLDILTRRENLLQRYAQLKIEHKLNQQHWRGSNTTIYSVWANLQESASKAVRSNVANNLLRNMEHLKAAIKGSFNG